MIKTEEARRHGVRMILGTDNLRWQHGSIPLLSDATIKVDAPYLPPCLAADIRSFSIVLACECHELLHMFVNLVLAIC